jgi:hypothetical protein
VDVGSLVNLATLLAVVAGIVFGVAQLRDNDRNRRAVAAAELVRNIFGSEFQRTIMVVASLPDGVGEEELRARGEEVEEAVVTVTHTWETVGWLVYRRAIELAALEEYAGGYLLASWRKLGDLIHARRKASGRANDGEWFQWLVERVQEHPLAWKAQGAHVALRSWEP